MKTKPNSLFRRILDIIPKTLNYWLGNDTNFRAFATIAVTLAFVAGVTVVQ